MFTFLFILSGIVLILLLLVTAINPLRSSMSIFELQRRGAQGDNTARAIIRREDLLPGILSLKRVAGALLLVIFVLMAITTFGWLVGVILAVIVALEYGALARVRPVRDVSGKLYVKIEPSMLRLVERYPAIFHFIGSVSADDGQTEKRLDSREELQQIISHSQNVLTRDEKQMIIHSLSFSDQLVSSVMTPSAVIDTINKSEFLGPLTLDELHKTGHSRLPVIDGDIDHIIGILQLHTLLALDSKRSVTAEKAMEARVFYIRQDQTLQHALAAFLRTHHHLFIVVNEYRETVGLLTLEDIIEALLGRKIIDEFDSHEDLRTVALRNPRSNNAPASHEDV